ncbi:hypothetical protein F7R05_23310 [Pseudomonas koreensis]|nr:hypothetical protein F7R05_23310 [Pseudomonas koreensis]
MQKALPSLAGLFHGRDLKRSPFVGVSLLAKASCQSTSLLNDTVHSRAGSLPHWISHIVDFYWRTSRWLGSCTLSVLRYGLISSPPRRT